MKERFCPNCHIALKSYDSFFCSNCGSALSPENIVRKDSVLKSVNYKIDDTSQNKFKKLIPHYKDSFKKIIEVINVKGVLISITFGVVIVVSVIMIQNQLAEKAYQNNRLLLNRNKTAPAETSFVEIDDIYKSHIFGADTIWEYIPDDIALYAEGHDFEKVSTINYKKYPELEEPIKKLQTGVGPHFAVIMTYKDETPVWTYVLFPYEEYLEKENYFNFLDNDQYDFGVIDRVLVITEDSSMIEKITNTKNKLQKNIQQSPKFYQAKAKMPKSGQFMIIEVSPKSGDFLNSMLEQDIPEPYHFLLTKFLSAKNYATVLK